MSTISILVWSLAGPSIVFEKKGVLSDYCSPNLNVNHFTFGAGMVLGPSGIVEKKGFSMKHLFHR